MRTKTAVACQNSKYPCHYRCSYPPTPSCRPLVPLIAMHKSIGKWSACFVCALVKMLFQSTEARGLNMFSPNHLPQYDILITVVKMLMSTWLKGIQLEQQETDEPESRIQRPERPISETREYSRANLQRENIVEQICNERI